MPPSQIDYKINVLINSVIRGEASLTRYSHSLQQVGLNLQKLKLQRRVLTADDIARSGKTIKDLNREGFLSQKQFRQRQMGHLAMRSHQSTLRRNLALNKQNLNVLQGQRKITNRFRMEYLGIMFLGMQMQRMAVGFLRDIINTYNSTSEEMSNFQKITNRLSSAWIFLKWRMIDTLTTSPLFKEMIARIAEFVDKLSAMDDSKVRGLVTLIGSAAAVGTLLFVIGQGTLGFYSLKLAINGFGAKAATEAATAKASLAGLSNFLKVGFSFFLIYEGIKDYLEGGIAESIDEWMALGLIWTAGLGWGVGFYLIFKGIETLTGETIAEHVKNFQEKIQEVQLYTPDSPISGLLKGGALEGSILYKAIQGVEQLFHPTTKATQAVLNLETGIYGAAGAMESMDEVLVKKSLVPSMELLNAEYLFSITQIGEMSELIPELVEKVVVETNAHYNNADAIRDEASAISMLASAKRRLYEITRAAASTQPV